MSHDEHEPERSDDADIAERIAVIEASPLDERARAYADVAEELRAMLEGDDPAGA